MVVTDAIKLNDTTFRIFYISFFGAKKRRYVITDDGINFRWRDTLNLTSDGIDGLCKWMTKNDVKTFTN